LTRLRQIYAKPSRTTISAAAGTIVAASITATALAVASAGPAQPSAGQDYRGPDWQTNPATQIRWGLRYIQSVYGSPCGAWGHETAYGWY